MSMLAGIEWIRRLDRREAAITVGAFLLALAALTSSIRFDEEGSWRPAMLFFLSFSATVVLAVVGLGVGPLGGARRPAVLAFSVLISLLAFVTFFDWIDKTPDNNGINNNAIWLLISLGVARVGFGQWKLGNSSFSLLIAGLAVVSAWSALWEIILSDGITAHAEGYRVILLALAVGFGVSSWLISRQDRPDYLLGGAVAAVLATGLGTFVNLSLALLGLLDVDIEVLDPNLFPDNGTIWQLLHLGTSLAVVAAAVRYGSRELGILAAISIGFFVVVTGLELDIDKAIAGNLSQDGSIIVWPLAMILLGAAAVAASIRATATGRGDPVLLARSIGSVLFVAGVLTLLVRRSSKTDGPDAEFVLFLLSLLATIPMLGLVGLVVKRSAPAWSLSTEATLAALLVPLSLGLMLNWIDSTPDDDFSQLWIGAASAAVAVALHWFARARFTLFLAGIYAVVAWVGLWNSILSAGVNGSSAGFRLVLLSIAGLLGAGAVLLANRGGEDGERIGPAGSELFAVAAVVAVVAVGSEPLSPGNYFQEGIVSGGNLGFSEFWEFGSVLLMAGLACLAAASGSRAIGLAAAISVLLVAIAIGTNFASQFEPASKIMGWPLALGLLGSALIAAALAVMEQPQPATPVAGSIAPSPDPPPPGDPPPPE